jgi:hypothetical protein
VIHQDHPLAKRQGLALEQPDFAPQQLAFATHTQGFTTEDILWSIGIWSVIVGLSPVIVFYVLMVA